jgi:phosphotransferase system  glucose/maltose/N-acetylglucosamine-specific IIC component
MTIVPTYTGPQCPRCSVALTSDWIRSGAIHCPYCNRAFEATAFSPPQRKQVVTTEVVTVGPEGANACANHARNAATASCQRCGLFICALCDMNVGTGSYCPSCFERVRTEGTLQAAARRYRDYATMARSFAIAGIFFSMMFLGLPLGAMAMYYGVKARKQRRSEGRSIVGPTFAIIAGVLEILAGIASILFLLYAIGKAK